MVQAQRLQGSGCRSRGRGRVPDRELLAARSRRRSGVSFKPSLSARHRPLAIAFVGADRLIELAAVLVHGFALAFEHGVHFAVRRIGRVRGRRGAKRRDDREAQGKHAYGVQPHPLTPDFSDTAEHLMDRSHCRPGRAVTNDRTATADPREDELQRRGWNSETRRLIYRCTSGFDFHNI